MEKKGKGNQYHLPEAVGNNIDWGRGEENRNFREENQDLKKGVGKKIKLYGTLYTPVPKWRGKEPRKYK